MYSVRFVTYYILFLALINSVRSEIKSDITNSECITKGAQDVFKTVVSGIKGFVEPSDPLNYETVKVELPNLNYEIINGTFSGLKNCHVTNLTMNPETSTFRCYLACPQLVMSHYFIGKGNFGPCEIDGEGLSILTLNDYLVIYNGEYGVFNSDKDQKRHFLIKRFYVEFEPKGEITIDTIGPLHSDKAKSDFAKAYAKENVGDLEKIARTSTLKMLMTMFFAKVDTYLRSVPTDQLVRQS